MVNRRAYEAVRRLYRATRRLNLLKDDNAFLVQSEAVHTMRAIVGRWDIPDYHWPLVNRIGPGRWVTVTTSSGTRVSLWRAASTLTGRRFFGRLP